MDIIRQVRRQN